MLESGIDPGTSRLEVGRKSHYCKYNICSGARATPPGIIELKRRFLPVNTCTRNSNHADFALPNPAQTWQDCNQLNENRYSTLHSPALCAGQKGQGRRPAEGLSLPYAAPPLFKAFTLVNNTSNEKHRERGF